MLFLDVFSPRENLASANCSKCGLGAGSRITPGLTILLVLRRGFFKVVGNPLKRKSRVEACWQTSLKIICRVNRTANDPDLEADSQR